MNNYSGNTININFHFLKNHHHHKSYSSKAQILQQKKIIEKNKGEKTGKENIQKRN